MPRSDDALIQAAGTSTDGNGLRDWYTGIGQQRFEARSDFGERNALAHALVVAMIRSLTASRADLSAAFAIGSCVTISLSQFHRRKPLHGPPYVR